MTTFELLERAKSAKGAMATASTEAKNRALLAFFLPTPWIWRRPGATSAM